MISADQSNIDSQRGRDPVRDEHAHQMTTAQRYQEFFTRKNNSWDARKQYDLDVIVPKDLQNNIHFWYLVYLSSELIHHRIGAFYQKHESAVEPEDAKNVGQLILEMAVHAYEEEQKRGIDFLTQLNNRELFKRQLNLLEQEVLRPNDLAVVMIDLDDFKKANEAYGHPKGDILLRKIAERMKEKVNEFFSFSTALFRYGGEEFVAIVPLKTEESRDEFVKHLHDFCEALTSEQYDLDGVSYEYIFRLEYVLFQKIPI